MLLHGVENPDIRYRDSLAQDHAGEEEKYTLVLANPPFAGILDYENTAKDLLQIVKTKKTELLFLALFLRLLKPGGRAAVIVPDGVLFGSSKAHKDAAPDAGRGPEARRRRLAARRRVQALRRRLHRDPRSSPRPTPAAPTTSGSTTWRPTAGASTTSARRCCPTTSSAPCPTTALTRRRTREEQPARRARALGRSATAAEREAPAHRAELLRAQGRHRRAGLRPLAQPLQGSGPRRGRAPPAEGDPRRASAKLEEEIQQGMKELEGMLK